MELPNEVNLNVTVALSTLQHVVMAKWTSVKKLLKFTHSHSRHHQRTSVARSGHEATPSLAHCHVLTLSSAQCSAHILCYQQSQVEHVNKDVYYSTYFSWRFFHKRAILYILCTT